MAGMVERPIRQRKPRIYPLDQTSWLEQDTTLVVERIGEMRKPVEKMEIHSASIEPMPFNQRTQRIVLLTSTYGGGCTASNTFNR